MNNAIKRIATTTTLGAAAFLVAVPAWGDSNVMADWGMEGAGIGFDSQYWDSAADPWIEVTGCNVWYPGGPEAGMSLGVYQYRPGIIPDVYQDTHDFNCSEGAFGGTQAYPGGANSYYFDVEQTSNGEPVDGHGRRG